MGNDKIIALFILIMSIFLICPLSIVGQKMNKEKPAMYKVNQSIEIPITVGLFIINQFGFQAIDDKSTLSDYEISQLDANDIWKSDRRAIRQDASKMQLAGDISDLALKISVSLPGLLAIDKKIRRDWFDLLVLYGETHAINTSIYISSAACIDRIRPLAYNKDAPLEVRKGPGTKNSYYSGHVSSAASASFFMAKIFSDYHPEIGNKKYWLFGAALIPPIVVGFHRYKAMKHFPTDIITGTLVGAAAGILIPELHKNKKRENGLSIAPVVGTFNGFNLKYSFKYLFD